MSKIKLTVTKVSEETTNANAILTLQKDTIVDLGFAKKRKRTQFLLAVDFDSAPEKDTDIEIDMADWSVTERTNEIVDEESGEMISLRSNWLHFKGANA